MTTDIRTPAFLDRITAETAEIDAGDRALSALPALVAAYSDMITASHAIGDDTGQGLLRYFGSFPAFVAAYVEFVAAHNGVSLVFGEEKATADRAVFSAMLAKMLSAQDLAYAVNKAAAVYTANPSAENDKALRKTAAEAFMGISALVNECMHTVCMVAPDNHGTPSIH